MAKVKIERPPTKRIPWKDRGQKWRRAGELIPGDVLVVNAPLRREFKIHAVAHSHGRVAVMGKGEFGPERTWSFHYRYRVQVA